MASGNPTLDKNLECIARYNPKLKDALLGLKYLENSIQLVETELKEPNLAYNGMVLHSQSGAEAEAKNVFAKVSDNPVSMHIIFGIGIGHLFKEFCEQAKGKVFLLEPNLEILRVTLELVDFSKELSQPNVFVASDIQSFKELYVLNYTYGSNTSFTYLGAYKNIYGEEMTKIFKQVETIMGTCMAEYNTLKREVANSISMVLDNLPYTLNETLVLEYKDIYKGKTALIVSAGPSLDANIEVIKKNRNKFIIFCVGTAYKALAKQGITPDFANIIEVNDCSGQVKDCDLSNVDFILEPYTHTSVHRLATKNKLLFPSVSSQANDYWAKLVGLDIKPYVAKGTVSYESLAVAKMMGFSKIILVGQDLAFLDNKCYSDESAYSQLIFEVNPETNKPEFKIKDYDKYLTSLLPIGTDITQPWCKYFAEYKVNNLNETLYFVKGISGKMIPTQGGYATFIDHFSEFAHLNKDLELINTSMVGAQIDGFKNMPLEDAIKGAESVERIELTKSSNFDKTKVLYNLTNEEKTLSDVLTHFARAKEYIQKYEREFSRRKTVSEEANRFFKKLLALYNTLTLEYYYKNPIYQALAFNENIEVDKALKQTETVTIERIILLFGLLKIYYDEVERKIIELSERIKNTKGIISEIINSEG